MLSIHTFATRLASIYKKVIWTVSNHYIMFVDELTIYAKAGNGGNGVVRWRHEKFKPKAGPAGGNGGNGGDVYFRAIPDLNKLSKYTGDKRFVAADGEAGRSLSQFGKNAERLTIDIPVGSKVTNLATGESFEMLEVGIEQLGLRGGRGGLGNEHFKSSTNRAPQESTKGKPGEAAEFLIEVSIIADIGLVGLPNAGKSSLLNSLTAATSKIGAYPFTTIDPHLGKFFEFTIADIPGLIEGAAAGKGLGHRFLRHVERTKMLLHLVSLDSDNVKNDYYTIFKELSEYSKTLVEKECWIIFTKKDLVEESNIKSAIKSIDETKNRVFVLSTLTGDGVKELSDSLVQHLRNT